MRLGIDLGGTKTEIIALDPGGAELLRRRIATPRGQYRGIVAAIVELVRQVEAELAAGGVPGPHSLGIGMPGTISPFAGLAVNANSTELNGQPLQADLEAALGRPIRFQNDANCLAVSEAVDGAAAGAGLVFAAILGTGIGAGIAIDGRAWDGPHRIAGEWGHNPLPWPSRAEIEAARPCFCGRRGCIETWVAGPSFERDHVEAGGAPLPAAAIVAAAGAGEPLARAAFDRYLDRLGRALAHVVNLLDPEVIVLGGGMSKTEALYARLPAAIAPYLFAERFVTPIRPARHGDSSGVRGAAWLWGR
ncbi:ROK family protein [Rhabdaerophilum calidifontis]|uniref:ROK family protein n=1 Tax=Rhabdaerophilum calidifontis TaxID=2604328 RepID=UPI00123930F0|nr:ROK family protein [Rhabdaerophilum calidifontis]